ncbi:rho GTPase-activating protein 15-like protein [Willisornis vidua]|uniref:Rho GTPase-activating protein 15-like protein n=1 Tax=Willisornis vidua TaxID=1566151 RepID=A0ABQ9CUU8_9PASS|nr:rho GTPase-activating protein 15-like protein [Willisornis vidua]
MVDERYGPFEIVTVSDFLFYNQRVETNIIQLIVIPFCGTGTVVSDIDTGMPFVEDNTLDYILRGKIDTLCFHDDTFLTRFLEELEMVQKSEEKLNLDDSQWEDIHVVTGALKMFFRELPEPLFPYCFFEQFVEAIKIQDNTTRIKSIRSLVKKLPRPNYDTMKILFEHLKNLIKVSSEEGGFYSLQNIYPMEVTAAALDSELTQRFLTPGKFQNLVNIWNLTWPLWIAAKESVNLMSTQSLGIVFGPTLLRPEKETGNMAVHMLYQNQIVELMLSEYSKIFGSEED